MRMTFIHVFIRDNNLSAESSANKDLILQISTVCVITARKKKTNSAAIQKLLKTHLKRK